MWLIDRIIGGVARPACGKAEDARRKTQDGAGFRSANTHRDVYESSRMSELPEDDKEDDEAWDPAVKFVVVDYLVAKQCNDKCTRGNDNDASNAGKIVVDSMK